MRSNNATMLDGLKAIAGSTDPAGADPKVLEDLLLEAFRSLTERTAIDLVQIHLLSCFRSSFI
jgi:hypothetical protein